MRALPVSPFLLKRIVLFFIVWLAMAGVSVGDVIAGLVVATLAAWLSFALVPPGDARLNMVQLAAMAPGFLWRSLLGGLDVARRAIDPRMPISPHWIAVPTSLPDGGLRATLGSEFSLMPGTLVAGSYRNVLLVHCLDTNPGARDQVVAEEARLRRALGLRRAAPAHE
ncbi:Na+/H+ antiporter subunit E [Pelagibacterium montanilacus]|uniref:Na+/H+ antiporter subunit E n=1 Tax=Pelagibacterium montanilacus TaxID=2185280 RepID=UPI0013E07BE7|nr:Na+/H+ antiporter subunit E [Pelagibacterium montanilacus]